MFLEQDKKVLSDIFTIARIYTVTNAPENKEQLQTLMTLEKVFIGKINKANKELGFVEELKTEPGSENVEVPEGERKQMEVVEENTATDPGATD